MTKKPKTPEISFSKNQPSISNDSPNFQHEYIIGDDIQKDAMGLESGLTDKENIIETANSFVSETIKNAQNIVKRENDNYNKYPSTLKISPDSVDMSQKTMKEQNFENSSIVEAISIFRLMDKKLNANETSKKLLEMAKETLKSETVFKNFLARKLCIKYRADALELMSVNEELKPFLPEGFVEKEEPTKDLFHTTGYQYLDMKKAMFKLISLNECDQFRGICENNQNIQDALENMLFATFYVLSKGP